MSTSQQSIHKYRPRCDLTYAVSAANGRQSMAKTITTQVKEICWKKCKKSCSHTMLTNSRLLIWENCRAVARLWNYFIMLQITTNMLEIWWNVPRNYCCATVVVMQCRLTQSVLKRSYYHVLFWLGARCDWLQHINKSPELIDRLYTRHLLCTAFEIS